MVRHAAAARFVFCAAALAVLFGCSGSLLAPSPRYGAWNEPPPPKAEEKEKLPDRRVSTDDVDFNKAFGGDWVDEAPADTVAAVAADSIVPVAPALRYPNIGVQKRLVRVLVRRGVREAAVQSPTMVRVRSQGSGATFTGRMQIEAVAGGSAVAATVNRVRRELRLPCTLYVSAGDPLRLGEESFRGALVIVPGDGGSVSFINVLDVEEYLRGVVPLEIGNLKEGDIEAVKAQAVAARTYTYKRMAQRASAEFDLVNTVADQVYGGANAEGPTSDNALILTKGLVMAYEDELVNAYYHSTCGGVTANVEDVWGAGAQPYLRSVSDARPDGRSYYCGEANWFSWTETWSVSQLSGIIKRYSPEGNLSPPYRGGTLRGLELRDRFECGRVRTLAVISSGEHLAGGDKVRFLLRRNTASNPILRSSKIEKITITGQDVTITGSGHGHGIGMCQVGAINRARSGQDFEQILKAYYSGISVRTAIPE